MLLYQDGHVRHIEPRLPNRDEVVWLHLVNPSDDDVHRLLGGMFGCHALAVEDVLHFDQRPKLDHYDTLECPQSFISFYSIGRGLHATEFCIVVARQYLITVTRDKVRELDKLYDQAALNPDLMVRTGRLLYRILDNAVDTYFAAVDELEEQLDQLEQRVFDHPEVRIASEIFLLKRRLHRARRLASDGRNVVGMLAHEIYPEKDPDHAVYFVDIFDHASRIVDDFDGVRDALSGLLDLQTAQRANRMNEVMKTLTIINTIFLPLSFIVGFYGTNLHLPEYNWRFNFLYLWGLLLITLGGMVFYFKRRGWW